jgi:Transglycosylase-like domain
VAKRFLFYAMAFFIGTTLLAGSIGVVRHRSRLRPAGSLWSRGTQLPLDGSLIRFWPHPRLLNPTAIVIPSSSFTVPPSSENTEKRGIGSLVPRTPLARVSPSSDHVWSCIRARESGGNYAENSGNGYYGAYQFSSASWHSVGGSGLPSSASPAEQDYRAHLLQQRGGWQQWPTSSRACGAR